MTIRWVGAPITCIMPVGSDIDWSALTPGQIVEASEVPAMIVLPMQPPPIPRPETVW